MVADRALEDRLQFLDAFWRSLSSQGLQSSEQAAAAASEGILTVDGRSMLVKGLCLPTIPLFLYQFTDSLCVTDLTLSDLRGLAALDMAVFLRLTNLAALSITCCPDLQSVVLTAPTTLYPAAATMLARLVTLDFSCPPALRAGKWISSHSPFRGPCTTQTVRINPPLCCAILNRQMRMHVYIYALVARV